MPADVGVGAVTIEFCRGFEAFLILLLAGNVAVRGRRTAACEAGGRKQADYGCYDVFFHDSAGCVCGVCDANFRPCISRHGHLRCLVRQSYNIVTKLRQYGYRKNIVLMFINVSRWFCDVDLVLMMRISVLMVCISVFDCGYLVFDDWFLVLIVVFWF